MLSRLADSFYGELQNPLLSRILLGMKQKDSPDGSYLESFAGRRIHCVGIKGSGMAALAEMLKAAGALVSGSDVAQRFFTDALLEAAGITPFVGFCAEHVPADCDLLVYSAAYNPQENPELLEAKRRNIHCLLYPQALGELSAHVPSLAVAGTHGKTSTTGMMAVLMQELQLSASALLGSVVPALGGHAVYRSKQGGLGAFFAAETCEYRRHFLSFHPNFIIITNIEADHLDYFRDEDDVQQAFFQFCSRLPNGGSLIFCGDDTGARRLAKQLGQTRPDIQSISYGFSADCDLRVQPGGQAGTFTLSGAGFAGEKYSLKVPGRHNMLNAAAVLAAVRIAVSSIRPDQVLPEPGSDEWVVLEQRGMLSFTGTRRRSELVGQVNDILIIDDYGHHPTEIRVTLEGIRERYPDRRLILDFMPHTYTRTESLWNDFLDCFSVADELWLHPVFASAREQRPSQEKVGRVGETNWAMQLPRDPEAAGRMLADSVHHQSVRFFSSFSSAVDFAENELRPGDVFVTMGAGDNYEIGQSLLERLSH